VLAEERDAKDRETQTRRRYERCWNEEFQHLMDNKKDDLDKYRRLRHLAQDFVFTAETYGKLIISERHVPNSQKTIRPCELGGTAGGEKYLHQNVLFKFAVDTLVKTRQQQHSSTVPDPHIRSVDGEPHQQGERQQGERQQGAHQHGERQHGAHQQGAHQHPAVVWMCGGDRPSDEDAMKVAGNELRGLIGVFKCALPGIAVPMMALIDYLGFRLIAIALLPIDRDTIVYGSSDGGQHVHADDPEMNAKMKAIGDQLNLRGHIVTDKLIYGPGDIEGHLGRDGRYYVLDYSRLFPAEAPSKGTLSAYQKRARFYRLLRPEFVRRYPLPLSSDAFTNFQRWDPDDRELNTHVRQATESLLYRVIPAFARRLDLAMHKYHTANTSTNEFRLTETAHREGIPLRHLGRLRRRVESPILKRIILCELVARLLKCLIHRTLRAQMKLTHRPSQQHYRRGVLGELNRFFSRTDVALRFWTDPALLKRELTTKFAYCLCDEEPLSTFDLRTRVDLEFCSSLSLGFVCYSECLF